MQNHAYLAMRAGRVVKNGETLVELFASMIVCFVERVGVGVWFED